MKSLPQQAPLCQEEFRLQPVHANLLCEQPIPVWFLLFWSIFPFNWWIPHSSNLWWNKSSAEGSKRTSESTRYTTPLCWPYPRSLSSSGCLYGVNVFEYVRPASGSSHYASPHSLCGCLAYSKLWAGYWRAERLIVGKRLSSFYLALFIYLLFIYFVGQAFYF